MNKEETTTEKKRNEWLTLFFKCKRVTGWPVLVHWLARRVDKFDEPG